MPVPEERTITAWQGTVATTAKIAGAGDPVVFIHGEGGLQWDPFLDALATEYTVYAVDFPGTSPADRDAVRKLDGFWDLTLCYDELLSALGLSRVPVIGHSFGGMVAAELAATRSERVSRLVLINPLGLWDAGEPVANWMIMKPADLVRATFHDPEGPLAALMRSVLENLGSMDPELAASSMWALACTGRFVWPIPDKGLARRAHRITSPTLVLWGRHDGIVPVGYAERFASLIGTARVEILEDAAHVPHLEQTDQVVKLVSDFLGT